MQSSIEDILGLEYFDSKLGVDLHTVIFREDAVGQYEVMSQSSIAVEDVLKLTNKAGFNFNKLCKEHKNE